MNQVAIWQGNQVVRQVVGLLVAMKGWYVKCAYTSLRTYNIYYILYNVYLFNLGDTYI